MWRPRGKIYVVEAPMGAFNNLSVHFHRQPDCSRGREFSAKNTVSPREHHRCWFLRVRVLRIYVCVYACKMYYARQRRLNAYCDLSPPPQSPPSSPRIEELLIYHSTVARSFSPPFPFRWLHTLFYFFPFLFF